MAIDPNDLKTLKPQSYAVIRDQVRDGDLLLCSATDFFSLIIRWATKSPWSHVAIAYRLEEIDRVVVLECVERTGVRAVPLSTFLSRTSNGIEPYPGQILLVRHEGMGTKSRAKPWTRIADFAFEHLGSRFSHAEVFKIVTRILFGRLRVKLHHVFEPRDEFICSEFVARCFEAVDLKIPWNGLGFIAPADIAADPKLKTVALVDTSKPPKPRIKTGRRPTAQRPRRA